MQVDLFGDLAGDGVRRSFAVFDATARQGQVVVPDVTAAGVLRAVSHHQDEPIAFDDGADTFAHNDSLPAVAKGWVRTREVVH